MANPVKGETPLVLSDGRAFTLVLDMEALVSVEDATGKPLSQIMSEAGRGFMTAQAAIAVAAFSRHHPDVTRGDVLEMLFSEDQSAVADALGKATEAAFPKANAEGNVPAKRQGGKNSGRNGAKRG